MKLQIKVNERRRHRGRASFKTYGCGSAIASSLAGDRVGQGQDAGPGAARSRTPQIAEELALPPVKIHCSILAEDAIKAAVARLQAASTAKAEPSRRRARTDGDRPWPSR
ncbi:MAG: iron-sulfur cluster assembly scaffold protein [Comamonadaceae bacterium]|nr:iron-sulfur cluster assembly scaffold protein [Comamonadaceae bacterium]